MTRKILLIDDSITQLQMLKMQFSQSGYEVLTATDGNQGYKIVFESAPDLVLSDIIMPNLNGYQLCRLLKNNDATKEIPIMLLTVLDKKIDKFWGSKSGANKFISKTAKFEEIEECARNIMEQNPVPEKYKEALINNKASDESVQNQINEILDELLMNSTFLSDFRDLGEYIMQESVLIEKIFDLIDSFVDYDVAGIFVNTPDQNEKKILHFSVNKNPVSSFVTEKIKRDFFSNMPGFSNLTMRDISHDIIKESISGENTIFNSDEFKTTHIVPLVSNKKLYAGICFYNKEECSYPEFKFYNTMINELLLLFKMRYLYSETEHLSVTDGLTGLYNRRHFECNIEREFLRVKRYPADLSIAMIDIDHFKRINDTYGHQFGDYVLKELSQIITDSFRKTDMIYRYGGEELSVILTETSLENSLIPLERLREKIANHKFIYNGEEIHVTVSIGIGSNFPDVKTQTMLVETADKALYKAKQNGRNKVVAFSYEQVDNLL